MIKQNKRLKELSVQPVKFTPEQERDARMKTWYEHVSGILAITTGVAVQSLSDDRLFLLLTPTTTSATSTSTPEYTLCLFFDEEGAVSDASVSANFPVSPDILDACIGPALEAKDASALIFGAWSCLQFHTQLTHDCEAAETEIPGCTTSIKATQDGCHVAVVIKGPQGLVRCDVEVPVDYGQDWAEACMLRSMSPVRDEIDTRPAQTLTGLATVMASVNESMPTSIKALAKAVVAAM